MKETLKLPRGVHGQSVRKPGLDAIFPPHNDDYKSLKVRIAVTSFLLVVCVNVL